MFIDTNARGSTAYLILNSMIMMSIKAYLCAFMSEFDWEGALEWNENWNEINIAKERRGEGMIPIMHK